MIRLRVVRVACGVLMLAGLAGANRAAAQEIGLPIGAVVPPVTVEDLDGAPVDLGQWIGKQPVLIEFWATWCPNCAALFPRMEVARRRFGSTVEFIVVAVGVNQSPRSIKRHLEKHPMPFTVLWDARGRAVRAFDALTTSYVVLLDAAGRVVYTGVGSDQDLESALAPVVGPER
ncbi:MAG: TlpA family protein disulfide reductase [Candidatus Krumholzibacteria bacterium]|nr:TlpA family protein disulfide reductase [Candidatus Krumholzibacteria bacterium]